MEKVKLTKFIPGGQTLGQLADGRKIFFWGALPGETVTDYQITKQKPHYLEAIATQIEQPAAERIAPLDSHYLSTSPWQILNYDYELAIKRELLAEQFRQADLFPSTTVPIALIPPVLTDNHDFFYRNKMEYSLFFDHSDQQIHPAFHARGSHRKIPVTSSSIERPELWTEATRIIAELNRTHAEARRYQSLLLRCDQTGRVSGGLYENHRPHPVFPPLEDSILGQRYSYSPNGFFQINLPVYELALQEIKQHISTPKVLDLYAGVGTIGLSVTPDRELTLVECDGSAYGELLQNASRGYSGKSLKRSVALAKSEDALDFITGDQTVIVDPPRSGCHPALLSRLLELTPPCIIYLSCNPATQARDAKILLEKYQITKIQPYNFFPRTPHLENLLVFGLKTR